ncbi:hypothetical protein C8Q72DRAFT_859637 [Fomitopsis betulina]|nr:hypothetical protein C8Q72DRAFT_859637 [Fomitopsis betulina]
MLTMCSSAQFALLLCVPFVCTPSFPGCRPCLDKGPWPCVLSNMAVAALYITVSWNCIYLAYIHVFVFTCNLETKHFCAICLVVSRVMVCCHLPITCSALAMTVHKWVGI